MKIISWNIAHRHEPWRRLLETDADIALLQEAGEPPTDVAQRLEVDPAPWRTAGVGGQPWRTAVVRLSDRVQVQWLESTTVDEAGGGDLAVSRSRTLAAALVTPPEGDPLVVVSMYAVWERPHNTARSNVPSTVSSSVPLGRPTERLRDPHPPRLPRRMELLPQPDS